MSTKTLIPPPQGRLSTFNPRMIRLVYALLHGPLMRKDVDRIAGCANGPDLIANIRSLGLGRINLPCILIPVIDRDGKKSLAGRYSVTEEGKELLVKLLNFFGLVACNETAN